MFSRKFIAELKDYSRAVIELIAIGAFVFALFMYLPFIESLSELPV